ncbi:ATP-binding protein [Streptomyces sp. NPDC127063]|uniref:ATP-binding protein n=1 Tax=Streptomyces sp. NPDC127063 TaxID=3347123 RepID=UPI003658B584
MTSAPPMRRGVVPVAGRDLCRERQGHRRPPARDLMSISFQVSPCPGRNLAARDAQRVQMTRRVTAARLRFCGLDALVDDAKLIVSELVTNAIVHSGGRDITLTVAVQDEALHIAVHDGVPGSRPALELAESGDAEQGRGLPLVAALAETHNGEWGVRDEGATAWCRLALPGEQS